MSFNFYKDIILSLNSSDLKTLLMIPLFSEIAETQYVKEEYRSRKNGDISKIFEIYETESKFLLSYDIHSTINSKILTRRQNRKKYDEILKKIQNYILNNKFEHDVIEDFYVEFIHKIANTDFKECIQTYYNIDFISDVTQIFYDEKYNFENAIDYYIIIYKYFMYFNDSLNTKKLHEFFKLIYSSTKNVLNYFEILNLNMIYCKNFDNYNILNSFITQNPSILNQKVSKVSYSNCKIDFEETIVWVLIYENTNDINILNSLLNQNLKNIDMIKDLLEVTIEKNNIDLTKRILKYEPVIYYNENHTKNKYPEQYALLQQFLKSE